MPATRGHRATFTVKNYPSSVHAQKISWACTCGKAGAVVDGAGGVTMRRARRAHARHAAACAEDQR